MVTTPCLTKEPSDNSPRRRNPYWIRRSGRKVLPLKAVSFNTEHANVEVNATPIKFSLVVDSVDEPAASIVIPENPAHRTVGELDVPLIV